MSVIAPTAPFVFLDDALPGADAALAFTAPSGIITTDDPARIEQALEDLQTALDDGYHAAGYFSYELGHLLERKLQPRLPQKRRAPLLWFGLFKTCQTLEGEVLARTFRLSSYGRAYAGPLHYEWSEKDYAEKFRQAHELISAGDIYQANISQRAGFSFVGDALALYLKLRATSQSAYCAFIDDGMRQVLSLSPEKFFDLSADGRITTRPMKGTAARHNDAQRDSDAREALQRSEKDRAENLMIVDLLRNDLGRIAQAGSVKVDCLFDIETYPTVHQMVSGVSAQLKKPGSVRTLLEALFPCGSVTGTPKIRAMEIIDDIETSERGIYCGAIGCFRPDGSATFNVAIRTLTLQNGRGELGIGSAVVYDSTAATEYEECLLKAGYFNKARQDLHLIETLRFTPGHGFTRLDLHLQRMQDSAKIFGFCFDRDKALQFLEAATQTARTDLRVRLTLDESAIFNCTTAPLGVPQAQWRYAVSPLNMQSRDELLRHKTSWRETYDGEYARLSAELNCDEVVFVNERAEITEGSRSNIFIRLNDQLYTPPLSCGLLNGCLRQEMTEAGKAREMVLTSSHLKENDGLYFGNSLRGLMEAVPALQSLQSA